MPGDLVLHFECCDRKCDRLWNVISCVFTEVLPLKFYLPIICKYYLANSLCVRPLMYLFGKGTLLQTCIVTCICQIRGKE